MFVRTRPQVISSSASISGVSSAIRPRLVEDLQAMILYAMGAGLQLPAGVASACENPNESIEQLAQHHGALARLIAPATPRAILLMHREIKRHPRLSSFAPIALMRHMMLIACVSTGLLLIVSLSPTVNRKAIQQDLLDGSGFTLFMSELFLIAAGSVGSSFAALFKLNRFVAQGTYDPKYVSSYWVQLVLGIICGLVLSQLLSHYLMKDHADLLKSSMDQPLLALLGGFSSSLVYRLLTRLLAAVESLFGGELGGGDSGVTPTTQIP